MSATTTTAGAMTAADKLMLSSATTAGTPNTLALRDSNGNLPLTRFVFAQAIPATIWTIDHNLPTSYPDVVVIDSAGSVVEGDIQYVSTTRVVLSFSAGFSGSAILT